MTILTEKILNDILKYLEKSMDNLAIDAFDNLEIEGGTQGVKSFLENQFDIRLENLLVAKKSSIHHLESGMKNKVIQKKQEIIEKISKKYEN
jgi:hypothetical protein|tara:strand:- start:975 stop:1250 length:276 start_codon:yes stop_codon:yes gene_type:complete